MKDAKGKLSICITTYSRSQLYLRAKSSLNIPKYNDVELVVIENVEGLAKARNLGLEKSKSDYVAYIDDDAVAEPDWVLNILKFIKSHPDVAAFGGSYTSLNQVEIPNWIPREVTTHIYPGEVARPIKWGYEWLTGTNMVFKRKVLQEIGGFDEKLGVKGTKRGYGEETELQIRLHNAGYEIWYDSSIKVKHTFAKKKQNLWYLLMDQYRHGRDSNYIFKALKVTHKAETASNILNKLITPNLHPLTRIYYLLGPLFYLVGSLKGRLYDRI